MNKKIFGMRLGTLIQFLLCLFLAIAIWLSVQYASIATDKSDNNSEDGADSCFSACDVCDFEV